MTEMHDQFAAEHPDIELEATTFGWGTPFYTRLVMGASGGNAADIATIHLSRLKSVSPDTLLDAITIDELTEVGIDAADFPEKIWDKCFVDDQPLRAPAGHARPGQLLQQGRLPADRRPGRRRHPHRDHRREEYFDVLRAVKEATGQYGTSLDTLGGWRQFWAWYRQADGEMTFGDDDFEMDDDKALQAIEVMYHMAEEGLCPHLLRRRPVRRQLRERRRRLRPGRQLGDQPLQALRRRQPRLVLDDRDAGLLRQPPHPGRLPLLCAARTTTAGTPRASARPRSTYAA